MTGRSWSRRREMLSSSLNTGIATETVPASLREADVFFTVFGGLQYDGKKIVSRQVPLSDAAHMRDSKSEPPPNQQRPRYKTSGQVGASEGLIIRHFGQALRLCVRSL